MKILLVTSSPDAPWGSQALAESGHDVVVAARVAQARKEARTGAFDVAVVNGDIDGKGDGTALADELAKSVPALKIVLVADTAGPRPAGRIAVFGKPSCLADLRAIFHAIESPAGPVATIDYPCPGEKITASSYTFRIRVLGDHCRVEVSVDGGSWHTCRRSGDHWWYDWSDFDKGPHTLRARALEEGQDEGTSAVREFVVVR
ncbi:MAG: hypothetical protein NTX64_10710 [Elusimicrobia bacterium]|nr:hypothetical protein [Elusimicrobiota bacterium]